MIYFTSDLHLDHRNIIKYCKRPFETIWEMNEAIVSNWNARVTPEDTVYLLGDFALTLRERLPALRQRLNGRVVLVRGNHDRSARVMLASGFDEVHELLHVRVDGTALYLRHQPDYKGAMQEPGVIHLCGHVHTDWKRWHDAINVGVDQWNFQPVTLAELLAAEPTDFTGRTTRRPVGG